MDNIQRIEIRKQDLFHLARSHMNTEAGTSEEIHLYRALDRIVNELLASGVSEAEIRRIISNGQAYGNGRRPPPFVTRRYMTPAQSREIGIMTNDALYNPIEDDNFYDNDDDDDNGVYDGEEGVVQIPDNAVVAVPGPRPGAAAVVAVPRPRPGAAAVVAVPGPRPSVVAVPGPRPGAAAVSILDGEDVEIDSKNLDEIQTLLRCPICLVNIKDIRLSPCNHMMCKTCFKYCLARREHNCPICRKQIISYGKVYYSKYLKYKNKYLQLKNKVF